MIDQHDPSVFKTVEMKQICYFGKVFTVKFNTTDGKRRRRGDGVSFIQMLVA